MTNPGVTSTNIPSGSLVDEFLGNRAGSTVRVSAAGVAAQFAATGPIAEAIASAEAGIVVAATWLALAAINGTRTGQAARVPTTDIGTHTDPVVGGTVKNSGEFGWSTSPAGWRRLGDVIDANSLAADLATKASQTALNTLDGVVATKATKDELKEAVVEEPLAGLWPYLQRDGQNKPVGGHDLTGAYWHTVEGALVPIKHTTRQTYPKATSTLYSWDDDTDLLVIIDGQSLARAYAAAGTALTTAPLDPGFALMPSVGVWPDKRAFDSFVDLREADYLTTRETIASACANTILEGLWSFYGKKRRLIMAISAEAGVPYSQLRRGSINYNETLRIITQCAAISAREGRKLLVPAVLWLHGEADHSAGISQRQYAWSMQQLLTDLQGEVEALTGQTERIRMVTYATARGFRNSRVASGPVMAQTELPKVNGLFACCGPVYSFPTDAGDLGHITPEGYTRLGHLFGRAVLGHVCGLGWRPMEVDRWWMPDATTARIRLYVPAGGIVIDTSGTYVANPSSGADHYLGPAAGWQAIPPDASSYLTLTGCSIVAGTTDTIDVTFAAPPPPGYELQYAMHPTSPAESDGGGNIRGPRGLIRNDVSTTAPGVATPDYSWLVPTRLVQGA